MDRGHIHVVSKRDPVSFQVQAWVGLRLDLDLMRGNSLALTADQPTAY
jgi:hypothetical protein